MEFLIFNSFQAKGTSRGSEHSTTIEWTTERVGTDTKHMRDDNNERSNRDVTDWRS